MTATTPEQPPATRPLVLGTATASYQVEGATSADGRGPSIWDTFAARPGAIADGSDGSVACGSYQHLAEDLALLEKLGVGLYRFSIAWPRVQPDGHGPVNPAGLDYYERLVDGLLARGMSPAPTLYHWDLPQALEDAGGWLSRETALRLTDYALAVHDRLGDRVRLWATLNEPWCSAFLGYAAGVHAPGRREGLGAYAAAHHLLLGHALTAAAIRERDAGADVGIVLNLTVVRPEGPDADGPADFVDAVQNRLWVDALVDGSYPADLVEVATPLRDPQVVHAGDLEAIRGSASWLGVNYYTPMRVGAPEPSGPAVGQDASAFPGAPALSFRPREPRTEMGWEVDATGLEDLLVGLSRRAPGLPLRVTENGAAYADENRAADGTVDDPDRIAYLEGHLAAVRRARAAGADVRAYIAWTLLDNFEWAEGYTKKFGLVEIEPGTLRRIPKRSFHWFADAVRAGGETSGGH